jgi:hypothetical protein
VPAKKLTDKVAKNQPAKKSGKAKADLTKKVAPAKKPVKSRTTADKVGLESVKVKVFSSGVSMSRSVVDLIAKVSRSETSYPHK